MPTFERYTGSAWTPPSTVKRWSGSAWVDVGFVRRWSGSAWVDVWPMAPEVRLLANMNLSHVRAGGTCYAGWRLNASGKLERRNNTGTYTAVSVDYWMNPENPAQSGLFEVRCTSQHVSPQHSPFGDAVNSWLALSTSREWYTSRSAVGGSETKFKLEIRLASTGAILLTKSDITCAAFRSS